MNNSTVRIASAQYRIEKFISWDALQAHISRWVEEAALNGARLIVFPEYSSMEMAGLPDSRRAQRRSPERHLLGPLPVRPLERRQALSLLWASDVIQPLIPRYLAIFATLAAKHRAYVLPGSLPFRHPDGSFTNRAFLFAPDGRMAWQDKMVLSRWERDLWKMRGGAEVRVFESEYGRIGVDICYDIEFPVVARRQAEAGACIILAPCCCDSLRGYYRVRVGAQARALENQAYIIQSPAIGNASWLAEFDRLVGFAGIFGPPDVGLRESGIVAQGTSEQAEWIYGDLDLAAIDRIRDHDTIANVSDWTAHMTIGAAVRGDFINVRHASEALSLDEAPR